MQKKLQNSQKVCFFEGMSPKGHINLTKHYLQIFKETGELYVGESLRGFYSDTENVHFFKDGWGLRNKYFSILSFVFNSLKVLWKCKKQNVHRVIFLSYNANVMFVISWVAYLLKIKVYCFEHNTVPEKASSFLKRNAQRLCSERLTRLCYMPSIVELYRDLNQSAIYVPHPAINVELDLNKSPIQTQKNFRLTVFCPSGHNNVDRIELLAKRNVNILFIIKSKSSTSTNNVISKSFFEDYYEVMAACDVVFLPIKFDFRVSGPFFEALRLNKKVIVDDCEFGNYVKNEFPSHVIKDFSDSREPRNFDFVAYNKRIEESLKGIVNAVR